MIFWSSLFLLEREEILLGLKQELQKSNVSAGESETLLC